MRRLSLLLATVAVIVASLLIYNHTRQDRWRPLPGGGEIRLMTMTYEKEGRYKTGGSIFEPLRQKVSPHLGRFLGSPALSARLSFQSPELLVWFTTRYDPIRGGLIFDEQSGSLNDGTLATEGFGEVDDRNKHGLALFGVAFAAGLHPERRLHIHVVKDKETLELEADNPVYGKLRQPDAKAAGTAPGSPLILRLLSVDYGKPVPGKPGFVASPYAPAANPIDVRGFPPDTEVRCPYTQRILLVP